MKKTAIALVAGACAGMASIPLAVLPSHFLPSGPEHNTYLPLAWFLGNALQGISAAFLLALAFQSISRHFPRAVQALVPAGSVAVLGVLVPCPGITNGAYADGLTSVYAVAVGISAAIASLSSQLPRSP